MTPKDEILAAVAAAIADLRKEHAADLAALRQDFEARAAETQAAYLADVTRVDTRVSTTIDALAASVQAAQSHAVTREDIDAAVHPLVGQLTERLATMVATTAEHLGEVREAQDALRADIDAHATLAALALEEQIAAAVTPLQEALGTMATREHVTEALAPLQDALDGKVDPDQMGRALGTLHEALATLFGRSAGELIAEAITPLRERLEDLDRALAVLPDLVTMEHVAEALATSEAAVSEALAVVEANLATALATKADVEQVDDLAALLQEATEAHEKALDLKADQDRIDDALAPLQEALEAQETVLHTLSKQVVLDDDLEGALSPLRDLVEGLQKAVATRASQGQLRAAFEGVLETLRTKLLERYQAPPDWANGGTGYRPFSLVRHHGAIWQSVARTFDEPSAKSHHWIILSDAVESMGFERREPGQLTLVTRYASGAEHVVTTREPIPRYRGVYDATKTYAAWDTCSKDSHVFLALRDAPTTGPGPDAAPGEWQVFSGPRGRKGKDADTKALADEVMREVVPQIEQALNKMGSKS